MRFFKFAAAFLAVALPSLAFAQSSPGLRQNQVPTAAQWNGYFSAKQDVLGFTPFGSNGGTLTGKLTTAPSTTATAGLALPPGTAPTSPINGDIWTTTAGLFARINGSTVGPFASSAGTGLTIGGTTVGSGTSGRVLFDNAGSLGEYVISGTGSVVMTTSPAITTPSFSYGTTGSSKTILATSANTGFTNDFTIGNGGTVATAATIASLTASLTAGTNAFVQMLVTGGATPTATLATGAGITGGFTITSGAGALNLTTPTLVFGTTASSTISAKSANTGFSNIFAVDNGGTVSNAGTIVSSQVTMSAGTNVFANLTITGGATPTATFATGSGVTGGMTISAGAGTLTLASPTTTGKLTTAASTTGTAGFSCPPGVAPTSPINGDFWCTTAGAFYRANGSTQGPFGAGGGSLPAINDGQVLANTSGSSAQPVGTNATTWFDKAWCNTGGYIIARMVSVWTCSNAFPVNAVWFGAVGNGTTDDTNAIKAALAVSGLKPVYLPKPGTCYLVSSDMALASGQEIFGDGQGVPTLCIKSNAGFTNGVLKCPGSGIQPGPTVRDMQVTFTQPFPTPAATTTGTISGTTLTVVNGTGFAVGQTVGPIGAIQQGVTLTGGSGTVWTLSFSQPSYSGPIYTYSVNALRAQLTAYKPFLYCQETPRTVVRNVLLQDAWDGYDMRGNSGGMFLDTLQISAFNTGIYIDGSLDTNHVANIHCWPFNVSGTQYDALVQTPNGGVVAAGSKCMDLGRSDGLLVTSMSTSLQLGVYMHHGSAFTPGDPGLVCVACNFDTFNGVVQEGGSFQMTGGGIGVQTGVNGFVMSSVNGGANTTAKFTNIELTTQTFGSLFLMQSCALCNLSINQLNMTGGVNTVTLIGIAPTVSNSNIWLTDSYINMGSLQLIVMNVFAPSAGVNNVHINNNIVQTTANVAFANPIFQVQGSCGTGVNRATITNNRTNDKGAGGGTFISKACAQFDVIQNNTAPGWTITIPSGVPGVYGPNPT